MKSIKLSLDNSLTEEIIYCKRCHRKLKDNQSKSIGYGKVCYAKINTISYKNKLFDMGDNNE